MIHRDSLGRSYLTVRGEIVGFVKDANSSPTKSFRPKVCGGFPREEEGHLVQLWQNTGLNLTAQLAAGQDPARRLRGGPAPARRTAQRAAPQCAASPLLCDPIYDRILYVMFDYNLLYCSTNYESH